MESVNVGNFYKLKEVDYKLLDLIKSEYCVESDLEDSGIIELDGVHYGLIEVSSDDWSDEGKYSYSSHSYTLVSFDNSKYSYPNFNNVIDFYNIILEQGMGRTGSYYNGYDYEYDEPSIGFYYLENIPEVVIPAHKEVRIKYE